MSETYNVEDFIPDSTGEIDPVPDPDEEKRRVIVSVEEGRSSATHETKKPVLTTTDTTKKHPVRRVNREKGRQPTASGRSSQKKKPLVKSNSITDQKKFTILIPDELLRRFRIQALTEGVTYSALGVEAIQSLLQQRASVSTSK